MRRIWPLVRVSQHRRVAAELRPPVLARSKGRCWANLLMDLGRALLKQWILASLFTLFRSGMDG